MCSLLSPVSGFVVVLFFTLPCSVAVFILLCLTVRRKVTGEEGRLLLCQYIFSVIKRGYNYTACVMTCYFIFSNKKSVREPRVMNIQGSM